jgi:hypothetical protein
VVREGVGAGGEMTQALYAHMNNKTIKIKINKLINKTIELKPVLQTLKLHENKLTLLKFTFLV